MRRLLLGLALLLSLLCPSRRAYADLSQDVYADAKDIITELIERDVAESIAADLACYSPDGLLKYFPESLQAVYERNMGAIKMQLERETVSFAANYAFECFRQKRTIPLEHFLPVSGFNPNDPETSSCRHRVRERGGPAELSAKYKNGAIARGEIYFPLDRCNRTGESKAAATNQLQLKPSEAVEVLCPFAAAAAVAFKQWSRDLAAGFKAVDGQMPDTDIETYVARGHEAIVKKLIGRLAGGKYEEGGLLQTLSRRDFQLALRLLEGVMKGGKSRRQR